jgi:hypothetical protein
VDGKSGWPLLPLLRKEKLEKTGFIEKIRLENSCGKYPVIVL